MQLQSIPPSFVFLEESVVLLEDLYTMVRESYKATHTGMFATGPSTIYQAFEHLFLPEIVSEIGYHNETIELFGVPMQKHINEALNNGFIQHPQEYLRHIIEEKQFTDLFSTIRVKVKVDILQVLDRLRLFYTLWENEETLYYNYPGVRYIPKGETW